jgi:hypothetical protein
MHRAWIGASLLVAGIGQAMAGVTNAVAFIHTPIPTLDEIGLTVLIVVVAVAGGIAARRRKKK